ncbi:hypothetical protein FRB94_006459 [Tulasnella sp. JGI-2019a]|nr:hypothetical protein FRB93_004098 [Tulasnella sp. JGI-2019a]KAG8999039.1 hypothetical protein FRB94_006459 [Tulasnella sp. JGI-2019a]KAG9027065.1 hypothetical protein FRB95_008166 [Tulasnella sp. JGI-2019a]
MGKKKAGKKAGGGTGGSNVQNGEASSTPPAPMASTQASAPSASTSTPPLTPLANGSSAANGAPAQPSRSNSSFATATTEVPKEVPKSDDKGRAEPTTDPEQLKEQGNFYFKEKEFDIAIDLYTQAIAQRPDPTYYTNRAAAQMSTKRFKQALEDCNIAMTLQSESPSSKTLARTAKCHVALGDPASALRYAQQALDLDPGNKAVFATKAMADQMQNYLDRSRNSYKRKDWREAKWLLEQAMAACEGDYPMQWRVWRVEMEIARKNWDEAASLAAGALRQDTNSPDALAVRALVLFLTNQIQPAIDHLRAALRSDQEHSQARALLRRVKDVERTKEEGNSAFKVGKWPEAVAKWTDTLGIIGANDEEGGGGQIRAILLSNRATTLLKMKKLEEALEDTLVALELQPSNFKALRTQGRIRMAQEEYEEAVRDFKRAQEACSSSDEGGSADMKSIADELRKAEVALKRSKEKDYYKILNVARDATDAEIKKAYRRESLLHHPDKGGNEEQFKLVVEANTVLSDPQRRARYDAGEDEDGMMDGGGAGMHGNVDLSDILFAMGGGGPFGGGGFGGGRRPGGGFHSHGGPSFSF